MWFQKFQMIWNHYWILTLIKKKTHFIPSPSMIKVVLNLLSYSNQKSINQPSYKFTTKLDSMQKCTRPVVCPKQNYDLATKLTTIVSLLYILLLFYTFKTFDEKKLIQEIKLIFILLYVKGIQNNKKFSFHRNGKVVLVHISWGFRINLNKWILELYLQYRNNFTGSKRNNCSRQQLAEIKTFKS